jgi:acyl carrier protein
MDQMSNQPGSPWPDDRGDDSLDLVELVMELEEEFDINIPDEEAAKIHTVADARRWIENHRRGRPG